VIFLLVLGIFVMQQTKSLRLVSRFLGQMFSLAAILAVGLGLPLATVYFFGEGRALLSRPSVMLFERLLQVSFIATASLLPALLFFLFDRYQMNTLRHRLYRDLFRLDRRLKTRAEIDTKYGSQINEAYGPEEQGSGRLAPGTRWPVLVCAFVISMLWLAAFRPIGSIDEVAILTPMGPERTAFTFGFLGAYFFGLQVVARRFARGDLKPKAYGYITIRILTVAVLSWVLDVLVQTNYSPKLVAAFLIGIVPDEFFTLVRERFRRKSIGRLAPESEKHPLTKLEGIDLYDRARLEQEGIVNVESFAHHELIRLVLETRIPVSQLVDWMDQAILYLHCVQDSNDSARSKLREYGIRTTTDLLACWKAAKDRPDFDDFKMILGTSGKLNRLEVIRDALLDDEWLARVQDWRDDSEAGPLTIDARPRTFESKRDWAIELEQGGAHKEAIKTYEDALEIQDDAVVRLSLAQLLASAPGILRNADRSRDEARAAARLGQNDFYVLLEVARFQKRIGDVEEAIAASDRAIEIIGDPKDDKQKQSMLKELNALRAELEIEKNVAAQAAGK
jgi:tetratricopeptide (TPR) repeat protein